MRECLYAMQTVLVRNLVCDSYGEVIHRKQNQLPLRIVKKNLSVFGNKIFVVDWLGDWRSYLVGKRKIRF